MLEVQVLAAQQSGIPIPDNLESFFYDSHPHFHSLCLATSTMSLNASQLLVVAQAVVLADPISSFGVACKAADQFVN